MLTSWPIIFNRSLDTTCSNFPSLGGAKEHYTPSFFPQAVTLNSVRNNVCVSNIHCTCKLFILSDWIQFLFFTYVNIITHTQSTHAVYTVYRHTHLPRVVHPEQRKVRPIRGIEYGEDRVIEKQKCCKRYANGGGCELFHPRLISGEVSWRRDNYMWQLRNTVSHLLHKGRSDVCLLFSPSTAAVCPFKMNYVCYTCHF